MPLISCTRFSDASPGHELEIVDDDQVQALFGLQPASAIAHLGRRDPGGVVDEDLGLRQHPSRLDQPAPLRLIDVAGPQPPAIQSALHAEEPLHQLLLRHLQAEQRDHDCL